jgi:16S rRNA (cytosine967-C5)-methyltransferase
MTLRVNILRQPRIAYLQQLQQAGIVAAACRWSEVGIVLEQAVDVGELPGFNEGSCSVQDEASQLVAPLLIGGAAPTRILDCCCAPGGKTGHILELAGPGTHLDAIEIDESRLARVEQNLSRLGLPANLIHADATQPTQWWNGDPYDAILLDAPCSASGVIRRHPDIKLLRQPGDIGKLNQLQSTLLDAVWPCLSSGGSLMYTSCSVLREENDQIVDAFVQRTEDAVSGTIDAPWGNATACGRQHLPDAGANDGFFYARISKC